MEIEKKVLWIILNRKIEETAESLGVNLEEFKKLLRELLQEEMA